MAYTTDCFAGVPMPGNFASVLPPSGSGFGYDGITKEPIPGPSAFQSGTTALYAITVDKFAGCVTTVALPTSH